jgi:hypothetical protein
MSRYSFRLFPGFTDADDDDDDGIEEECHQLPAPQVRPGFHRLTLTSSSTSLETEPGSDSRTGGIRQKT